jgi:pyruvate ferredoxin oxidoreductase alpha subunit
MTTVNRALSGPINIHCDHSDTMGGRDTGWIQLYGENHQEAYDNCIMSVRIAESMDIRTPTMHMYDGYVISGAIGPLQMLTKEQVQKFIGPYHATNPMLDTKNPVTVGPFDGLHGWYFEHKVSQNRAMDRALTVIQDVADEYAEISGRQYGRTVSTTPRSPSSWSAPRPAPRA